MPGPHSSVRTHHCAKYRYVVTREVAVRDGSIGLTIKVFEELTGIRIRPFTINPGQIDKADLRAVNATLSEFMCIRSNFRKP